jgi:hypothetical protein
MVVLECKCNYVEARTAKETIRKSSLRQADINNVNLLKPSGNFKYDQV